MIKKIVRRLNLNLKILIPFIVLYGTIIFILLIFIFNLKENQAKIAAQIDSVQRINTYINEIYDLHKGTEVNVLSYTFNHDSKYLEQVSVDMLKAESIAQEMDRYIHDENVRLIKDTYETSQIEANDSRNRLISNIQNGDAQFIDENFEEWVNISKTRNTLLEELKDYNTSSLDATLLTYDSIINDVYNVTLLTIFLSILFALTLYLYLRQVLEVPITKLSTTAARVSDDEFPEFDVIDSPDEIGKLSRSLKRMSENLKGSYEKLKNEVSEKEEALRRNIELERRKDDFISMASHELRTPLAAIKVLNHVLVKTIDESDSSRSRELLHKMDQQVERLNDLVEELLDVSKISNGTLDLHSEPCTPDELVGDVITSIQRRAPTHIIEYRPEQAPRSVNADCRRVRQVLSHLLKNAVKYSPINSKVIVNVTVKANEVIFSVKDFGIGISKEHHQKIFDRFYRVYDKSDRTFPGMGMGLFISNDIVKAHGGRLWVESSEGKGSTFYFTLPCHKNNL
jgi:signal transduction histidine kinase